MQSASANALPFYLPDKVRSAGPVRFLLHPAVRYLAAWILALSLGALYLDWAWDFFCDGRRGDGNQGHTFIDFGGQWLLGRMIVEGHGRNLYHRGFQRAVLLEAYPREHEVPVDQREPKDLDKRDATDLLGSFMGYDDRPALASLVVPVSVADPLSVAVLAAAAQPYWEGTRLEQAVRPRGGPLYPPVHALLFAPVSRLDPQSAYRLMQIANIVFAFLAGLGVSVLLRGRFWWPLAAAAIIVYPGFPGTVCLGQNAPITLAILVWGWVLTARGRPGWGGVVWGLFAFKPVWGLAFFLVPLLTARWRMCLSMVATGMVLAAVTLPIVGLTSWFDWLAIGRMANQVYDTDVNWIFLSRDLLSIPRRWLLDFADPSTVSDLLLPAVLGRGLLLAVFATTALLAVRRRATAGEPTGPPAAFLFLGAWLCCFHFMYYDVLLSIFPVFLLFAEPEQYLRPVVLVAAPLEQVRHEGYVPVPEQPLCLLNNMVLTLLAALAALEYVVPQLGLELFLWVHALAPWPEIVPQPLEFSFGFMGTPWNTFALLVLWLWCARLWRQQLAENKRASSTSAP